MKILYIEDEINTKISDIVNMFSKYLGESIKGELNDLLSTYGGKARIPKQAIQEIVEKSGIVHIEYRFPDALKEIIQSHKKYDLIIVDRNLSEEEYDESEVLELNISAPQFKHEDYTGKEGGGREGDYIFHYLFGEEGKNIIRKFYFLSAYPFSPLADDSENFSEAESLAHYLDLKLLGENNFVPKDDKAIKRFIEKIINKVESINLRHENLIYLNILEKCIEQKASNRFWTLLQREKSPEFIEDNLSLARKIYENIYDNSKLNQLAGNPQKLTDYLENKGNNWQYKLQSGAVITSSLRALHNICNNYGAHERFEKNKELGLYQPTLETIQAVVCMLKDIILWFDKVINEE